MRIALPGFSALELARLRLIEQDSRKVETAPPVQRRFAFPDSFETTNSGLQRWLVRREGVETQSGVKGSTRPQVTERALRSLFADGFERPRVPPVDLGHQRSTANAFRQAPDQTQARAQGNGFVASVADLG